MHALHQIEHIYEINIISPCFCSTPIMQKYQTTDVCKIFIFFNVFLLIIKSTSRISEYSPLQWGRACASRVNCLFRSRGEKKALLPPMVDCTLTPFCPMQCFGSRTCLDNVKTLDHLSMREKMLKIGSVNLLFHCPQISHFSTLVVLGFKVEVQ